VERRDGHMTAPLKSDTRRVSMACRASSVIAHVTIVCCMSESNASTPHVDVDYSHATNTVTRTQSHYMY
jgi:hypothetical protein